MKTKNRLLISILLWLCVNNEVNAQLNIVRNFHSNSRGVKMLEMRSSDDHAINNQPNNQNSQNLINPQQASNPNPDEAKQQEFYKLMQELYQAQAQVQMEAAEIQKSQRIAETAQQNLEESVNNVKIITAALHTSQETVALNAIKAQNSQLQLAAHDQLLFEARQKVDRLSAELVTIQAELGVSDNSKDTVDVKNLINKLRQPLSENEKPKPALTQNGPSIAQSFNPRISEIGRKRNVGLLKSGNSYDSLTANELTKLVNFLKKHKRTIEKYFDKENL